MGREPHYCTKEIFTEEKTIVHLSKDIFERVLKMDILILNWLYKIKFYGLFWAEQP